MTAPTANKRKPGTAARALDVAEALVQKRGYNGFSYADVVAELGITTASLHYHFPGKGELGVALIRRYSERFAAALDSIDAAGTDCGAKISAFADLYVQVLRGGKMCLCGMLAADYDTLPPAMQVEVIAFFDATETWLAKVLEAGRISASLKLDGDALETARGIVASLEGGMLVARPYRDVERFQRSVNQLLAGLHR